MSDSIIDYTLTDEAPALATRSLLPILQAFCRPAGVALRTRDISLAGRILAAFPEHLSSDQRVEDALAELGALARTPDAVIVKLPNISASQPQLERAVAELQAQGYPVPDVPESPETPEAREVAARYARVKGSAVNPVLREGNSDRRAPAAVKAFARSHPHRMGAWSPESRTHVATLDQGDFRHTERSFTTAAPTTVRVEHHGEDGTITLLKDGIALQAGEVFDGATFSMGGLRRFLRAQLDEAREQGILFSLHLKATMMKVSDPILFGEAVKAYFAPVFEQHGPILEGVGANPRDGLAAMLSDLAEAPADQQKAVQDAIEAAYASGPDLAMVDSDRGITNLHVPSDVIIDASMPAMIRNGGKMWGPDGETRDCKAVIPESSYAGIYQAVIDDCRTHGAFDPTTMGTVPNVGLMAQKAEEYGSHDKTFEIPSDGTVKVVDAEGTVRLEHRVEAGDLWRGCQVKDAAVTDWVRLAVRRARATGWPAVFWLDADRAHDAELIRKVRDTLDGLDTDGLDLRILSPVEAMGFTLRRVRAGEDTISVTGNVLRDYLTDLFPILEVGTSAKMLSIVPLMQGGGLFETGAGGSAPKHVQQLVRENHLRWDSLGEFLAVAVALEHIAERDGNERARVLGETLDAATTRYLMEDRGPRRVVHERDTRGAHAWLARYWAEALAERDDHPELAARFAEAARALGEASDTIEGELLAVQGEPVELGGYFLPDEEKVRAVMRPSATLNRILDGV
jgi:isocitrate dehydrogenase